MRQSFLWIWFYMSNQVVIFISSWQAGNSDSDSDRTMEALCETDTDTYTDSDTEVDIDTDIDIDIGSANNVPWPNCSPRTTHQSSIELLDRCI